MQSQNESLNTAVIGGRALPDPSMTGDKVVSLSEDMVPLLRERMVEVDRTGHVSKDTWQRLEEAGFIHSLRPREYGGLEWDDYTCSMALLELARGCASTAWCATVVMGGNMFLLGFPDEVHEEIWGEDTYATMGGNANINPQAKVDKVDGGYRISGKWGFGSGTDFTSWLMLAAMGDGGMPSFFLIRQSEATLLDDWNVTGLRGTNSQTMVVEDVFVPERRVLPLPMFPQRLVEHRANFPTFDALWYPFHSPGRFTFSCVALGAAIGAAEYMVESLDSASRLTTLFGATKLADQEYTAIELAEITADLELARSLVELRSRQTSKRAADHEPPTPEELAVGTRDSAYLCRVAQRNVGRLLSLVGSKAGNPQHPVSIAKRDVEMASAHVGNNWRNAAVGWMASVTGAAGHGPGGPGPGGPGGPGPRPGA